MKSRRVLANSIFLLVLSFLMFPRTAHAYLDMGTGSYLLQIIVAGFFGAMVAVRIYWNKIKIKISSVLSRKKPGQNDE